MTEIHPSDNPSGADNEQGSPTATDLAWIAGHFDGDGWIGMARQRRTGTNTIRYTAAAQVTTTSERIAHHLIDVMGGLGIKPIVQIRGPHVGSDGSPRRRKWAVSTRSNKSTKVFLGAIRPYLIEKGHQADLVLEYIEWRDTQPRRSGGGVHNGLFAERGEETMRLLREDRQRDDPSTTTRLAPAVAG